MKSLKFTLAISLLAVLWPAATLQACWYSLFRPQGYYMYRVFDPALQKRETDEYKYNPGAHNNCLEWQRYTSPDIPLADIYQVVYKMPLEAFEQFCERPDPDSDNKFLAWLACKAPEAFEFLLFAKITEDVRGRRNSRWYYPSMRTGARMTLEDIAETALAYRGPLRDRYLLQAVRALVSLNRYGECVELWEKEVSRLPKENAMRQLIQPYIAGAEEHLKHHDRAIAHYTELGDIYAVIRCAGNPQPRSTVETIAQIHALQPNCEELPRLLQEFVHKAEPDGEIFDEGQEPQLLTDEHRQLARLAVRIAQEGKTDNPAMWYYTAAFIEDLDGHAYKASLLLAKAEQAHGTDLIKNSVKVMRIYLDAKLLPYTQAYEKRLQQQLQWLDGQIAGNLTQQVRERTSRGWDMPLNVSYYYWNDMLRRILLGEVCPRMIEAGKPIRALQLANMADNRLPNLVDNRIYSQRKEKNGRVEWMETTTNMRTFRYTPDAFTPDYSNYFFEMIDSLGLRLTIEYRNRVEQPRSTFDCFLNERGYVNPEYLDDIVGTQCLRAMRYEDAVFYLGRISRSFEGHLNTSLYWDPFSHERRPIADDADFKYRFAREMRMLEQEIAVLADPDRKAERMLRFAIGLNNSFGRCWSLTQYYRGTSFYGASVWQKRDWSKERETLRARARVQDLLNEAIACFTDRASAAKRLYELHQFRTVAEQFSDTETGRYVRGACDNLRDYAISPH